MIRTDDTYEAALEAARIGAEFKARLDQLPLQTAQLIVAGLQVELETRARSGAKNGDMAPVLVSSAGADSPARQKKLLRRIRNQSRKTKGERAEGVTAKMLQTLAAHPQMSISELAGEIYGDTKQHGKVRSLLNSQKEFGKVRRVAAGRWEVVKTE